MVYDGESKGVHKNARASLLIPDSGSIDHDMCDCVNDVMPCLHCAVVSDNVAEHLCFDLGYN